MVGKPSSIDDRKSEHMMPAATNSSSVVLFVNFLEKAFAKTAPNSFRTGLCAIADKSSKGFFIVLYHANIIALWQFFVLLGIFYL